MSRSNMMVDGAGFEPASSVLTNELSLLTNEIQRLDDGGVHRVLDEFGEWLEIDELRRPITIGHHVSWIRKLLNRTGKYPEFITKGDVRSFLKEWKSRGGVYHYSNAVKAIRVFFRFLEREEIGNSFKFPRIERPIVISPPKEDVRKFYYALNRLDDELFFLIKATSGLRRHETKELRFGNIDTETRMVIPDNGCAQIEGTKNTYITFINEETLEVLNRYRRERRLRKTTRLFGRGFAKSSITYRWNKAFKKTGVKLTPDRLRDWFCNEMATLGVADRYIDAFCGRVPRSVLARHYTDYSPERLKQIYDNANLRVLS